MAVSIKEHVVKAVFGVLGGLLIVGIWYRYAMNGAIAISPGSSPMSVIPAFVAPTVPAPPSSAELQTVRARYISDRDRVRKANPKTEDEVTKIIGRPPDNIMQMPQMTIIMWYYEDKEVGRDVLQIATQNGRITIMNL